MSRISFREKPKMGGGSSHPPPSNKKHATKSRGRPVRLRQTGKRVTFLCVCISVGCHNSCNIMWYPTPSGIKQYVVGKISYAREVWRRPGTYPLALFSAIVMCLNADQNLVSRLGWVRSMGLERKRGIFFREDFFPWALNDRVGILPFFQFRP